MVVLVDSGSTKSDWVLMASGNNVCTSTIGLNPFFYTQKQISETILENKQVADQRDLVSELYFYGAGCSGAEQIQRMEQALKAVFPNATISVESDIMASVLSCYQGKPMIACILGTGSNCCFYDGTSIQKSLPSLGFILGDEGSGAFFGKQLLRAFLYKQLPAHLEAAFEEEYQLTATDVLESVYRKEHPNRYLAGFVPFISAHAGESFFQDMIYAGFKEFLKIHVCSFAQSKTVELHFVGSIALVFEAELKRAADELSLKIGSIIQKPMEGLISYHENK